MTRWDSKFSHQPHNARIMLASKVLRLIARRKWFLGANVNIIVLKNIQYDPV